MIQSKQCEKLQVVGHEEERSMRKKKIVIADSWKRDVSKKGRCCLKFRQRLLYQGFGGEGGDYYPFGSIKRGDGGNGWNRHKKIEQ